MEEHDLKELQSKNPERIKSILEGFNHENANLFNFSKFHTNGQWRLLWRTLFTILGDDTMATQHKLCLNTVRILTRDEFSLQTEDIVGDLNCLLMLAHLTPYMVLDDVVMSGLVVPPQSHSGITADGDSKEEEEETLDSDGAAAAAVAPAAISFDGFGVTMPKLTNTETLIEALKCLCNLVFQSADCRRHCVKHNITDGILKRVASSTQHPCTIELYDLKLLFLLTGFEAAARNRVQIDLNGLAYMTEWLDERLSEAPQLWQEINDGGGQLEVLCEMLKVMFNITTTPNENEIECRHLTGIIRELLYHFGVLTDSERRRNVVTCAVNLLTNLSSASLSELITKIDVMNSAQTDELLAYEGHNVRALDILLGYLQLVVDEHESNATSPDLILPALTVLLKCAHSNATMRHYIRSVVLPPLRDISQRPEVGNELRNRLCRYLTSPNILIRDLAAELLFVCCKENVGRMIKHTGYGNAAGLFANRGVLDCRRVENSSYSSDSEDSDTEEYKQLQNDINPVLGCYESPIQHNLLDGMSEQQKEYEAMELVKQMDKLLRSGVVQPCRIGDDGKPQPVDHILQLQEELPQQQLQQKRKD